MTGRIQLKDKTKEVTFLSTQCSLPIVCTICRWYLCKSQEGWQSKELASDNHFYSLLHTITSSYLSSLLLINVFTSWLVQLIIKKITKNKKSKPGQLNVRKEKLRDYLLGCKFTMYTDNNPLTYVKGSKLGVVQIWWLSKLALFDIHIKYQTGKSKQAADTFSYCSKSIERSTKLHNTQ